MALERVCVIGAGTIGSLVAAHLVRVAPVSVLTRRPEHAAALSEHGLRVSGKAEFTARVSATSEPAELDDFDLGVFATKATGLEAAASLVAGRAPGAAMMTMQNGLGAEEVVSRQGPWPLISSVTFMSGIRHGDAHVEYELDTATWMGPYAGTRTSPELVAEVGGMFRAGGLKAEVFDDLRPAQWSKLIFNAAVNGTAALTGLPHVRLFAQREEHWHLGHLLHDLIAEGRAVAAAVGVELREDPWDMNCLAVERGETAHADYAHLPSMLEDVQARRPTEVEAINGQLVRAGERLGVPVPLNAAVYRLVKAKEESWKLARPKPAEAVLR